MITARPTPHLTGITLEGEFDDFSEIVDSIYRITGLEEDQNAPYWGVKNRLLGLCYDIRHAYQGDRNVLLTKNGVHDELMKWHAMVLPKNNVHYSVEILFPEAVFVALSVPELYQSSSLYYGTYARKHKDPNDTDIVNNYSDYLRDRALMDWLCATILHALAEVIGDDELEKLIRYRDRYGFDNIFRRYATHYIDKCNIEYLRTDPEKRSNKLRNIAKRMLQLPDAYMRMRAELELAARRYGCSIYELDDPRLEYPENIEW